MGLECCFCWAFAKWLFVVAKRCRVKVLWKYMLCGWLIFPVLWQRTTYTNVIQNVTLGNCFLYLLSSKKFTMKCCKNGMQEFGSWFEINAEFVLLFSFILIVCPRHHYLLGKQYQASKPLKKGSVLELGMQSRNSQWSGFSDSVLSIKIFTVLGFTTGGIPKKNLLNH